MSIFSKFELRNVRLMGEGWRREVARGWNSYLSAWIRTRRL